MGNKSKFVLLFLCTAVAKLHATSGSPIPDRPVNILSDYCLNCHDEVEMKGDVNLDHLSVDWTREENLELWERVLHMAEDKKMPPEKKRQPTLEERATLVAWLDETLSDPAVLRREATRLLPSKPEDAMVQSFTSQWLDTKLLPNIMPDPVFKFVNSEIAMAKREVEHFFTEMLTKNLPMTDFIDPDFHYTSPQFAKDNYQYPIELTEGDPYQKTKSEIQKLPLPRGGRFGGLLAQSAIMTATANGVDTQPVLRGVWVLENILGTPPPEPPQNVPALPPDIRGAKTPREMLAAHMADKACSTCHSRIDPLGLMLENFDPVGNWREVWPKVNAPIDSTGVLPDGTHINDITDFKAWLVDNIDMFSQCLAEKLMIYATGRVPNYSERKEIEGIVYQNQKNGNGFQDLLLALITSKTFRSN